VHCKVFEDNAGCCEWSALPNIRPRAKHLGIRLHHFCERVRKGKIVIHKIPTGYQLADLATKAQLEQALCRTERDIDAMEGRRQEES